MGDYWGFLFSGYPLIFNLIYQVAPFHRLPSLDIILITSIPRKVNMMVTAITAKIVFASIYLISDFFSSSSNLKNPETSLPIVPKRIVIRE